MPVAAPAWLQLGVFVIDASTSMTCEFAEVDPSLTSTLPVRSKAQAVDCVLSEFVERMKRSRNAANFRFAFVSFHHAVSEVRGPRDVLGLSASDSYDPTANGTGGTAIYMGLEAAEGLVSQFMNSEGASEIPVSAVVAVLSDGEEMADPARTLAVAQRLRTMPNTMLAAGLFATNGQPATGEGLLKAIVSRPDLYERVNDGEELRRFFQASMTATPIAATPTVWRGGG